MVPQVCELSVSSLQSTQEVLFRDIYAICHPIVKILTRVEKHKITLGPRFVLASLNATADLEQDTRFSCQTGLSTQAHVHDTTVVLGNPNDRSTCYVPRPQPMLQVWNNQKFMLPTIQPDPKGTGKFKNSRDIFINIVIPLWLQQNGPVICWDLAWT